MFDAERAAATERLQEVRALYQLVTAQESELDPRQPEPDQLLVLRGLFFVLLYAYFESSVNRFVSATLNHVSGAAILTKHLQVALYSLALNPTLTALESSGKNTKWRHRVALFADQDSSDRCAINDVVLSIYLQNIWHASLLQVFSCLGIREQVVPSNRHIGYVDELVDKRNAIAHGREAAADVGRRFRSSELLVRLDAVAEVVAHLEASLTTYLDQKLYIADSHRAAYP